jgi:hypothetical protein
MDTSHSQYRPVYINKKTGKRMVASGYGYKAWKFRPRKKKPKPDQLELPYQN